MLVQSSLHSIPYIPQGGPRNPALMSHIREPDDAEDNVKNHSHRGLRLAPAARDYDVAAYTYSRTLATRLSKPNQGSRPQNSPGLCFTYDGTQVPANGVGVRKTGVGTLQKQGGPRPGGFDTNGLLRNTSSTSQSGMLRATSGLSGQAPGLRTGTPRPQGAPGRVSYTQGRLQVPAQYPGIANAVNRSQSLGLIAMSPAEVKQAQDMKARRRLAIDTVHTSLKPTEPEEVSLEMAYRSSCHRCGNLRRRNVYCDKCPHIFCQK